VAKQQRKDVLNVRLYGIVQEIARLAIGLTINLPATRGHRN